MELNVSMALKIQGLLGYAVAVGYQCFRGLHPEDGGSKVLQNNGILLQHCMM